MKTNISDLVQIPLGIFLLWSNTLDATQNQFYQYQPAPLENPSMGPQRNSTLNIFISHAQSSNE
jgi:hypothetical protein